MENQNQTNKPSPYILSENSNPITPEQDVHIMSVRNWITIFLVLLIPIVNLLMLIGWSFDDGTNPSRASFCKAVLIFMAFSFLFLVLFSLILSVYYI